MAGPATSVNQEAGKTLGLLQDALEKKLDADVMAIFGPIIPGAEHKVRTAIEVSGARRRKLAVFLHTPGGIVEIAERMVNVIRHHYKEVVFVIADVAMSAGTVFAMSGDVIMMDYFSCLGPIDPQVQREGKLVPALSYLVQFKRLTDKAAGGQLTTAEFALLNKLDLAELHQFEEARALSQSLLEKWLVNYKFKDWTHRETSREAVTLQHKQERAKEIARRLSDNEHWHSHGRGIPMEALRAELNLRIDDFGTNKELADLIHRYESLIKDYVTVNGLPHFVHARSFI
jgi:membrane-bound ClpP family serine protease